MGRRFMTMRVALVTAIAFAHAAVAATPPERVVNGWDFPRDTPTPPIVRTSGSDRDASGVLVIRLGEAQTASPVRYEAIECEARSKVKLKLRVAGHGTLAMGCHYYNRSNHWLGMVRAETVAVKAAQPTYRECNVTIPVHDADEVATVRPYFEISGRGTWAIGAFDYSILPPPSSAPMTSGGDFPPNFERLVVQDGDFALRVLPSIGKIAIDEVERPFIDNANAIIALRLTMTSVEGGEPVVVASWPFEEGVIRDATADLLSGLAGDYRVTGEYLDAKGRVLARGEGYSWVDFEDLASGRYIVGGILRNAHLENWLKTYKLGQKTFRFARYPFEVRDIGPSAAPLPGFLHPELEGNTVSVWGRKYRFASTGLFEQVSATQPEPTVGEAEEELLAGAVTLVVDGEPYAGSENTTTYTTFPDAVEVRHAGDIRGAALTIHSRVEQDGVVRLTVQLVPSSPLDVGRVTLRIPLHEDQATLFHELTDTTYRRLDRTKTGLEAGIGGHAGYTPSHKVDGDVVWRSIDCERIMPGSFNPLFWLGNEDRGFCYFADSDKGWLVDDGKSALELERRDGQVVLNINLVNRKPAPLAHKASWVIGLVATPVKPRLEHARGTIFPRWATLDKPFYKSLTNLRKLVMIGAGDPHFTAGSSAIQPLDAARTRELYEALRDERGSTYLEYWCSDYLPMSTPELATYFGEWSAQIRGAGLRASSWYKPYPGFEFAQASWIACRRIVPSYLDYRLWCFEEKLKDVGQLAFYEDNIHLRRFFDPAMGYGYYRGDGHRQVQFDLWSLRDYYRRIAEVYRRNGMENLSGAHASAAMVIPALTYCTFFFDGEQPARYVNSAEEDYVDRWRDVEYLRGHIMGRQFGIRTVFMSEINYSGDEATNLRHTRAWLSIMLPHDLGVWDAHISNREPVKAWHKVINDLDFYHQPPRLYPYWAKGEHKVFSHDHDDLLVTVYRQPGQALVILSNLADARELAVTLDHNRLGLQPTQAVMLEDNGEVLLEEATLTTRVPRHDYRLILLKE